MARAVVVCYHGAMRHLDRVLWWGLLATIVVRIWTLEVVYPERTALIQWVGFGIGLVWCVTRPNREITPWLAVPCGILLLSCLLGIRTGDQPGAAFSQSQTLAFGIILCVAAALAGRRERQRLLGLFVGIGIALSLHAIWQATVMFPAMERSSAWTQARADAAPDATTPPSDDANHGVIISGVDLEPFQLELSEQTVQFAKQVIARRRAFGPFPLPGLLAAAFLLLLPVSIAVLIPWATTVTRRIAAAAVIGAQTAALLLTQSMGGFLSICVASVLVLAFRHRRRRWFLAAVGLTLVSIGLVMAARPEFTEAQSYRNPIVQRWGYWVSTAQMIREHPFRGIGAGNYPVAYARFRQVPTSETHYAHNVWLQVWAEWGLLGLLGLVGLFVESLYLSARQPIGYQIAVWAFWLMASIDIAWSKGQLTCLWWPLIGLCAAPEPRRIGVSGPVED